MSEPQILSDSPTWVVVNKRSGELVQTGRPDRNGHRAESIADRLGRSGSIFVVHRLDRPVTGVVLFARTRAAAAELSEQFRNGTVSKTYWAIVDRPPGGDESGGGVLRHRIVTDGNRTMSRAVPVGDVESGRPSSRSDRVAELSYRIVGRSDRYWFLELRPVTGRRHQIRAQLAACGSHIKGDVKYGARRTNPGGGICLHARSIEFSLSDRGTPQGYRFTADPPADPLWDLFPRG